MPLKATVRNKILTLTYTNDKETAEASFKIPPDATDEEILSTVRRFLTFAESQMGIQAPPGVLDLSQLGTAPTGVTATRSVTSATTASPEGANPSGSRVLMMPPASLSDRPADGGPPSDVQFYQSLPTKEVPSHLTGGELGWELDPEAGAGW